MHIILGTIFEVLGIGTISWSYWAVKTHVH